MKKPKLPTKPYYPGKYYQPNLESYRYTFRYEKVQSIGFELSLEELQVIFDKYDDKSQYIISSEIEYGIYDGDPACSYLVVKKIVKVENPNFEQIKKNLASMKENHKKKLSSYRKDLKNYHDKMNQYEKDMVKYYAWKASKE